MYDKRFLKVKKLGEERYFLDNRELYKFMDKQSGMTFDDRYRIYNTLLEYVRKGKLPANSAKSYWESHINTDNDRLIIGNFLFRILRGYFERIVDGCYCTYSINILAEQKADLLSSNDRKKIFSEQIQNSKAF